MYLKNIAAEYSMRDSVFKGIKHTKNVSPHYVTRTFQNHIYLTVRH